MFDFLAIDWGSLRIGLAFGNFESGLVLPFDGNLDWQNFWQILKIEIKKRQIQKIIVGMPTNWKFGKTETGFKIEEFMQKLRNNLEIWQLEPKNSENNSAVPNLEDIFATEIFATKCKNYNNFITIPQKIKNTKLPSFQKADFKTFSLELFETEENIKNNSQKLTLQKDDICQISADFQKKLENYSGKKSKESKFKSKIPSTNSIQLIIVNERNSTKQSQKINFKKSQPISTITLANLETNWQEKSWDSPKILNKKFNFQNQNNNIFDKTLSKKKSQNLQKFQKQFQKSNKVNKINTNHLAAVQILTTYFNNLKT